MVIKVTFFSNILENPKELAKHLDELILSPEKRKKYGEANLNLSNSWPSWLTISEITLDVYKENLIS